VPDRGTGAATRTSGTHAAGAILIVLALGLAFRLIIAQRLPGSGFQVDLTSFRAWAANLAAQGPLGFYGRPFFHDYTPGYLYVLWLVGLAGHVLEPIGRVMALPSILGLDLIKLPPILADLVLGWLVWSMTQELGGSRRAALLGAAILVVNPVTWFDSVVWGQVDAVGTVFLLLGMRELWRDRPERSAIFTVIAAVIKPQLGILVPIVAAVVIRRALFPRGGYGDESAPAFPMLDVERHIRGPIRIATTAIAGVVTAIVLSAPFGLSIFGLIGQVANAAGGYPYLTVNAYNPWALLQLGGDGIAANGQWVCDVVVPPATRPTVACSPALMFGPVPAVVVGTVLLVVAVVTISLVVARRPDRRTILVGVAVMAIAFFVVPTRVHERYLFPLYAVAAILAGVSIRWRLAYVLLAAATFANMYVVLTTIYANNPQIRDWFGLGEAIRAPAGVAVVSIVHLLGFVWAASQLTDGSLSRLDEEIAGDDETARTPNAWPAAPSLAVDGWSETARDTGRRFAWPQPATQAALATTAFAVSGGFGGASPPPAISSAAVTPDAMDPPVGRARPVWLGRPGFGDVGAWGWLRSRIFDRPVRPDRSHSLDRESGGRFDRLDVWVLVVLVVASLVLRMWRLDEPYRMHFDEVYHARTATEFLQDWRYGIEHGIYEWTHPHLAKYAMAGGLVAFGNDRVVATSELGTPVVDAAIEPRWDDVGATERTGDRLLVDTGSQVRSYDLQTRALEATLPVPRSTALAVDTAGHRLFIAAEDGRIATVDLAALDARRKDASARLPDVATLATVDGPVRHLHVTDDGASLLVASSDQTVITIDAADGSETGRETLRGVTGFADAGTTPALVARPPDVPDAAAAASELSDILGGSAADYEKRLTAGEDRVVIATVPASGEKRTSVDLAIADERLAGMTVETSTRVAVAYGSGLAFLSAETGATVQTMEFRGGALGVARVTDVDDARLYVTTNPSTGPEVAIVTVGGTWAPGNAVAGCQGGCAPIKLPGRGTWVGYDSATQQVHVLGAPPAGRATSDPRTVYVIEPHANAVYADAALSFTPAAVVLDTNEQYQSSDREQLLAIDADGRTAAVDTGSHAFAWRVPGVIAGALMAGLLYVLTRILFRRRSVGVVVALLSLVDGMLFVQSRIGMNDAYVALFIIAAYVLFAAIWTGAWRWRGAFWIAMPAIGLLLGLALASKWVAAYAIGALGILILARSALGRVVLILGMIVVTTVLGYLAISPPAGQSPNLTFMLIMAGLTLVAVVATILHPIAWSSDEARFAVGAPAVVGVLVALIALAAGRMNTAFTVGPIRSTPLNVAFGLILAGIGVYVAFWLAGRVGFGPRARPAPPDDAMRLLEPAAPPAEGWLRPGWAVGLPVVWIVGSLLAIPLAVYVASYLPWAFIEGHRITDTWPAGHTGQTLLQLTGEMYRYHNTLVTPHAASSPWWAWPFDLKPVWFYQDSFAGGTAASIYDAGNLVTWWIGVPALAFCAWQAFARRSLGLGLVTIAFACQWVSWARIDRAAFQYHYYTSLPFVLVAVAYLVAEIWHGASARTWLLARLAAAAVVVGPAAMWLFHRPLCGFVRVTAVNPGSQACPTVIPEFVLTGRTLALGVILLLALAVIARQFWRLDRSDASYDDGGRALLPLVATAAIASVALVVVSTQLADTPLFQSRGIAVEPIAILVLIPLVALAIVVATARDGRRFVVGLLMAIVATFVVFYPNLSALPLPSAIANAYQGLLPTYVYPFQFPVNTVERTGNGPPLLALAPALLLAALTFTCVVVAYSAWVWRVTLAERRVAESLPPEPEGGAFTGGG